GNRLAEGSIALPLVLVADADRALLLRQHRDPGGELGERPARGLHDPQDLQRGHDPVARRGVLTDDDVAALLTAEATAGDLHSLEDVLVTDGGADDRPARGFDRLLEPAVRQDRHDQRPPLGPVATA